MLAMMYRVTARQIALWLQRQLAQEKHLVLMLCTSSIGQAKAHLGFIMTFFGCHKLRTHPAIQVAFTRHDATLFCVHRDKCSWKQLLVQCIVLGMSPVSSFQVEVHASVSSIRSLMSVMAFVVFFRSLHAERGGKGLLAVLVK